MVDPLGERNKKGEGRNLKGVSPDITRYIQAMSGGKRFPQKKFMEPIPEDQTGHGTQTNDYRIVEHNTNR